MSTSIEGFGIGHGLREASEVINRIPTDKLPLILQRIIDNLHIKDAPFFKENEKEQLCRRYGLSNEELKQALDGSAYIFEQAAYSSIAPEPLIQALEEAGYHEVQAKATGRVWALEGAKFIARLKNSRTGLGVRSLIQSEFRLNLVMAQGGHGEGLLGPRKLNEPSALIELTLAGGEDVSNNSSSSSTTTNNNNSSSSSNTSSHVQTVGIEMTHEELYGFFRQLEKIQQEHLDNLLL